MTRSRESRASPNRILNTQSATCSGLCGIPRVEEPQAFLALDQIPLHLHRDESVNMPENLDGLRSRGLGAKRSLASREFALGVEALNLLFARNHCQELMNVCLVCLRSRANR